MSVVFSKRASSHIGSDAIWRGDFKVGSDVAVSGQIDGSVSSRGKITVEPGARLHGNLNAEALVIEPGADVKGLAEIGAETGLMKQLKALTPNRTFLDE